ncbi:MAG: hypothetical protein ACYDC3_17070 [Candidatus Binataceae bacterium]
MAKKGILSRVASKTFAAGREHVAKILKGEESVPEAAGSAVENMLSGSKAKSTKKSAATKKPSAKGSTGAQTKMAAKGTAARKKPRSKK